MSLSGKQIRCPPPPVRKTCFLLKSHTIPVEYWSTWAVSYQICMILSTRSSNSCHSLPSRCHGILHSPPSHTFSSASDTSTWTSHCCACNYLRSGVRAPWCYLRAVFKPQTLYHCTSFVNNCKGLLYFLSPHSIAPSWEITELGALKQKVLGMRENWRMTCTFWAWFKPVFCLTDSYNLLGTSVRPKEIDLYFKALPSVNSPVVSLVDL